MPVYYGIYTFKLVTMTAEVNLNTNTTFTELKLLLNFNRYNKRCIIYI